MIIMKEPQRSVLDSLKASPLIKICSYLSTSNIFLFYFVNLVGIPWKTFWNMLHPRRRRHTGRKQPQLISYLYFNCAHALGGNSYTICSPYTFHTRCRFWWSRISSHQMLQIRSDQTTREQIRSDQISTTNIVLKLLTFNFGGIWSWISPRSNTVWPG